MKTLADSLASYLALRRAFGTELREPAQALGHFLDFLTAEGAEFVTTDLALRWATAPAQAQPATWARRLTAVRGFARWVSVEDPRSQVPPARLLRAGSHCREPFIFSDHQVALLIAKASLLPSPLGMRSLTYATLIGTLASTGLRPGEAVALDTPDVDLRNGVLSVRMTKFGKSRFVPIENSVLVALEAYAARRDAIFPVRDSPAFLVSEAGKRLLLGAAQRTFAGLCRGIGLRPDIHQPRRIMGPRLQDFRHTFATRTMVEWYRSGLDVERMLPRLSTYLGHSDVGHTYWYIQAVPELLQLAAERLTALPTGGIR